MSGIEILNTNIVYETEANMTLFFISLILCPVIGFFIALFRNSFDFGDALKGCSWGRIVGIIISLVILLGTSRKTDEVSYILYDVSVSDEVSFNEFMERYEIIEQKGNIYTVMEKKHDKTE